jgi:hypothetical protein
MRKFQPISILLPILPFLGIAVLPVGSQDIGGTNVGIPNSSPPILWPRGMSIEALSPGNLYPNGPQFGLSNTSGGFGMYGSGPVSGVGLAQRSVSSLVREEMERPYEYINRLANMESLEVLRSQSLFSAALSNSARSELPQVSDFQFEMRQGMTGSYGLPNVDAVLQDRPTSVDAVLRTNL